MSEVEEIQQTEVLTGDLDAGSGLIVEEPVGNDVNTTVSKASNNLKDILTWSPSHSSLGKPLFLFYLAVAGNYIGGLFNAKVVEILESNETVMHVLGFVIFSTTVSAYIENPTMERVLQYSVILYAWFELTTRMNYKVLGVFIAVLGIVYFLELRMEELHEKVNNGTATKREIGFYNRARKMAEMGNMVAVVITIIGVALYSDTWKAVDEDNAEDLLAKLKL
tara:strand:- start:4 stop:669 length:666 start_codon:yes stop_codon:yes gene_type:complete